VARPVRERELREQYRRQARRMADSGRHRTWRDVEIALALDGKHDRHEALSSGFVRIALDARCVIAKLK